jgi:hypothetical protein
LVIQKAKEAGKFEKLEAIEKRIEGIENKKM